MPCSHCFRVPGHNQRSLIAGALLLVAGATSAVRAQNADQPVPRLTLRMVLDSVLANHPTARAAGSRVQAAEGTRVTAGATGNPMLMYQVDKTPFPGGAPIQGMEREAMTTATIPLEFLYQRGPRIARANADVRAALADADATRQRLGLDAAAAYYRAGLAQIQAETTHDLAGWLDTLVAYNRSRVREGAAAEADLIRSELERDRVAAEASMQDAELARARAALGAYLSNARTLALPVVTIEDMPLMLPQATDARMSISESPTERSSLPPLPPIDARPDVRAARERLAASGAGVASERSMLIRQMGATIGTMQSGHMTSMIAGISLPVPLFDRNRGEIQRARAERDAAAFDLAAQERTAVAELRGAYAAARILADHADILTRSDSSSFLGRAEESRRIALGAYREGAVPLFQVIDAARAWADARMTYYRTIAAQHESVLSLIVAEGLDLFTTTPAPALRGGSLR